jgi:hypothetical protein
LLRLPRAGAFHRFASGSWPQSLFINSSCSFCAPYLFLFHFTTTLLGAG